MAADPVSGSGNAGCYAYFSGQNEPGLYLVQPLQPGLTYTCDIFLLHGLNGGATKTWQCPEDGPGHTWFRDHLPSLVKDEIRGTNARIWTFGYNASVFSLASSSMDLGDFVRSLLESVRQVRVGFEALIEAKLDALYTPIFDATVGIIFLATPHKGSFAANFGSIVASVAHLSMLFKPNTRLIRRLERHNDFLSEKSHHFSKICSRIKIFSFYETCETNRIMVVPKDSAVIGLNNEVSMPLNGDHRSIAQMHNFTRGDCHLFQKVVCELMAQTAPETRRSDGLMEDVPEGFVRCVISSHNGSKQLTALYPEHTTIEKMCESAVPRRWYRPNTITGLQRPFDHEQIPWYTDSIPAITSSGPSTYDFNNLRINKDEPVIVFFSKVLSDYCSMSVHEPQVRNNGKLKVELGAFRRDQLSPSQSMPNFPCIHVSDSLAISFHRTVRIPDDGGSYPAPNSLGALPLLPVSKIKDKLPRDAVEKGGIVVPLYDIEAMKINFHVYGSNMFAPEAKYAIRVFIGGVNGLSGEPVKANMATVLKRLNGIERTQDYLYLRGGDNPAQQWLDGVSIAPGIVRQFVAAQPLSSETIEHQITGLTTVGGIQIEIIPQLQLGRFQLMRRDHHPSDLQYYGERARAEWQHPKRFESSSDLEIPLQTRIHARMRGGSSRKRTLLDELDWVDSSQRKRRTVEFQLWPPPSIAFRVTVRCLYPRKQELRLSVFPETTLGFVVAQAAHALCLQPEMWTFNIRSQSSDRWTFFDERTTLQRADVRPGQVLLLERKMFIGGGSKSDYSPLLDVGAGGKIRQHIVPDEEDPRSWNVNDACLINIQIVNAESFRTMTGLEPPSCPISFDDYLKRGIPFTPSCSKGQAELSFGLARIKPAKKMLPLVKSAGIGGTPLNQKIPGYCDKCVVNWASYRLLPCRHLICANCGVDLARDDINEVVVHEGDCTVCSMPVVNMDCLKREPVATSQVTDDRDPFMSVVSIQPLVNASTNTFKNDIESEEERYESQPSGSEYNKGRCMARNSGYRLPYTDIDLAFPATDLTTS
ncbi:hypothetical protein B7494_g887 [Chlorociboria aeruginascens]|nr:hypothetical protein B7494_g887 [Chlorociboria aeruginascens]